MLASELPSLFARVCAFAFGAAWGSFFNVAIYRWPRDMSVVSPPSHCPACTKPIQAWRNVPIFGYLLLRGKAACCGARMSPRYVLVELLSALLAVAIVERTIVHAAPSTMLVSAAIESALWFVFVGGLVIATFTDLEWMEIPDEVSLGGAALGLATVMFRSDDVPLEEIVLGVGGGYLLVQLVLVWSVERLIGRPGMGEGDAKLMMFIGAFVGWRGALFALVAGSFQGTLAYAIAKLTGTRIGPSSEELVAMEQARAGEAESGEDVEEGEEAEADETEADAGLRVIPFGPFLALGALEFFFFGKTIVNWYFSLFDQ